MNFTRTEHQKAPRNPPKAVKRTFRPSGLQRVDLPETTGRHWTSLGRPGSLKKPDSSFAFKLLFSTLAKKGSTSKGRTSS